jgi:methyl-accepting chemotaxis protein
LEWAYILRGTYRRAALQQQQYVTEDNKDDQDQIERQLHESDALMRKTFDEAIAKASPQGHKLLTEAHAKYEGWWEKSIASRKAHHAGDTSKALAFIAEMKPLRLHADENFGDLVKLNTERMKEENENAENLYAHSRNILLFVSLASIIGCCLMAFFVLRATSRAIQAVITDLSEGAIQVSAASQQIAASSEEISQAATEQAASLEETAASIEEMNSMVAKNSENASSASQTSHASQQAVGQGQEVVRKMAQAMESINRSSEGMAATVAVIEQIDKETKVINEIVNKTELLSFNASVEAARAGEHGKGFAVVAEEVGNLARMSGVAAEKIAGLLEESKRKVQQMVQETKTNVATGTQTTQECGQVFLEIVENVNKVSNMASEIATASQEQSRGCAEITKAMSQLDQMTQQNTAVSEECASSAEELSAQAESLKNSVSMLVQAVNGGEQSFERPAQAPAAASHAKKQKAPANVVPIKQAKAAPARYQMASGDVPSYDSSGFSDV